MTETIINYLTIGVLTVVGILGIILIYAVLKALGTLNRLNKLLDEIGKTIYLINGDLPVILQNLRDITEDVKTTAALSEEITKKMKERKLVISTIGEILTLILSLKANRKRR